MNNICGKCGIKMEREVGVVVIEMFHSPPFPYRLWQADAFSCPKYKIEIVGDFGKAAFAEHFQHNFSSIYEEQVGNPDIKVSGLQKTGENKRRAIFWHERIPS